MNKPRFDQNFLTKDYRLATFSMMDSTNNIAGGEMMSDKLSLLAKEIENRTGVALHPASQKDIAQMKALGAPLDVINFFQRFEPSIGVEISEARLWPIADLVRENTILVPGAYLNPRGFCVIGTTIYGDAFCVDLTGSPNNPHPIVIMSHELSWEEMSDSQLRNLIKAVAESFEKYLELFITGQLDLEPLFD